VLLRCDQQLRSPQATHHSLPIHYKSKCSLETNQISQDEDGWRPRQFDITAGQQETAEERDLQTPDLYIPLMSFVTFILLIGVKTGGNQE
jgi:hypothetical protein